MDDLFSTVFLVNCATNKGAPNADRVATQTEIEFTGIGEVYNQLDGAKSTLQYWEDNLDECVIH